MPSIHSLVKQLRSDYPGLNFVESEGFQWSPDTQTVSYTSNDPSPAAHLLHELSHAILKHQSYDRDIELLGFERDAWAYTKQTLASQYDIVASDETIQTSLDSYRDWLHARSTCPVCQSIGLEVKKHLYHCPACDNEWRVNEARICALRRYTLKK